MNKYIKQTYNSNTNKYKKLLSYSLENNNLITI